MSLEGDNRDWADEEREIPEILPPLRPNRRNDTEMGGVRLTENNLSKHNVRVGTVNPIVFNYTSPIGQSSYHFCSSLILKELAFCRYRILSQQC